MTDDKNNSREDTAYKGDLEKLFGNNGEIPERFKALLAEMDDEVPDEHALWQEEVSALKRAQGEGFRPFVKAATQFIRDGHALPDDEDLLVRLLDHPSERVLIPVLTHMLDVHERVTIARIKRVQTRLDTVEMATDDYKVHQLITQLRGAFAGGVGSA